MRTLSRCIYPAEEIAPPQIGELESHNSELLRHTVECEGHCHQLREQAMHMVRCGFDVFDPADGSNPQQWLAAAHRYRHVYQRAADDRDPIFAERDKIASGLGHNRPDEVGV